MTSAPTRELSATRLRAFAPGKLFGLLSEGHKHNAIDLAVGTPSAPVTPTAAVEAACAALREGYNQYDSPFGNMGLREQIAAALPYPADPVSEVTVTLGSTEGLAVALLSIVDPGDEVVLFEPFYENFVSAIALAGGIPRFVRTEAPHWRYDPAELKAAFGPRTKAIVLNTPANPTGHVLSAEELAEIAELCTRWDVTVLSDEVYASYVFDGREHISVARVPGLEDRSIVIGSLSKSHAISGWRLGFLRAAPAITSFMRDVHIPLGGAAATPLQVAVARAAAADPSFWQPGDDLTAQRQAATKVFREYGFTCLPTEGGCYLMVDISTVTDEDSESYAYRLLRESGVMVIPATFFYDGGKGGDTLLRIAFNRPPSVFDDVRDRLAHQ